MKTQFQVKRLATALLFAGLSGLTVASHAVTINGGGATLPQPLYNDEFGITLGGQVAIPSGDVYNYVGDGSGQGRAGFLLNDPGQHATPSPPGPLPTNQPVHFGMSDAALSQSELLTYLSTGLGSLDNSSGNGRMIQLPMQGTAVLIYAKSVNEDIDEAQLGPLNDDQLCGIFSGRLTTWDQVGALSNPAVTLPATQIKVIVRQESSGTTTLLTQHFQVVCNSGNSDIAWSGNGTFRQNFVDAGAAFPSTFVERNGSGGVQGELNNASTNATTGTPEAIAYLSPDPSYDPTATDAFPVPLLNTNDGTGPKSGTNQQDVLDALGTLNIPTGAAFFTPDPNTNDPEDPPTQYLDPSNPGNPLAWVTLVPNPTAGYPIVGTTNMLLSQCYVGARNGAPNATEASIRFYLDKHYQFKQQIEDHEFVPLPSALETAIRETFLDGTSTITGSDLVIGDPTYCNTVTGRGVPAGS